MKKVTTQRSEMKLIGITCRTNNATIFNSDPSTNPISATVQKYFHEGWATKIAHQVRPGTTYCVYTDYESDFNGDYTYFIGEEVGSFDDLPEGFSTLTIPAQTYSKFTSEAGPMPDVCIGMWQSILQIPSQEWDRAYIADFEVYDERAMDHNNVVLDIYIGIKE